MTSAPPVIMFSLSASLGSLYWNLLGNWDLEKYSPSPASIGLEEPEEEADEGANPSGAIG